MQLLELKAALRTRLHDYSIRGIFTKEAPGRFYVSAWLLQQFWIDIQLNPGRIGAQRRSGGTGRRAAFRAQCPYGRVGSNPTFGILAPLAQLRQGTIFGPGRGISPGYFFESRLTLMELARSLPCSYDSGGSPASAT